MESQDQTKADLEALYDAIGKGWCSRRYLGPIHGTADGCLSEKMVQVLVRHSLRITDRYRAMMRALGFLTEVDLFVWNDYYANDVHDVQVRIKEALNKL